MKDKKNNNLKRIFETHAHYEDEQFDEDRDALLEEIYEQGIYPIVNVGSSLETTEKSIALAEQYHYIYAAVGVHPSDIDQLNEKAIEWLYEQAKNPKVVAIGEIGLDYYWPKRTFEDAVKENPENEGQQREQLDDTLNQQRYWFGRQLELAKRVGLPVIIHSRDAADDTYEVMRSHQAESVGGVVHCFSYSVEMAEKFIEMGFYIGVGGVVTFKNAKKLKEVVTKIPLERIVLETDCPYMAPEPHRGTRNNSLYLLYVVTKIAELKGIPEEEVVTVTMENAYRMYSKVNH